MTLYIGTYTGPNSKGIYHYTFDADTGALTLAGIAAEISNPSFLAIHPARPLLYCVNEDVNFNGKNTGSVSAFAIENDGKLRLLNQQDSEGLWPCHLLLTTSGDAVLVANYGSGTVASLPIAPDGRLLQAASQFQHEGTTGPNIKRQEKAHAHSVTLSPGGQFALAADLGLDKIIIYNIGVSGTLSKHLETSLSPGSGPRHIAFHPIKMILYVINELGNTITTFQWNETTGKLFELQTSPTLPPDFKGDSICADIHVHPSGKFVYGSNRGHDSITIFRADDSGKLILVGHQSTLGKHPRNFSLDPSGRHLIVANKDSHNLVVFKINLNTGALQHISTAEAPSPVCVRFVTR